MSPLESDWTDTKECLYRAKSARFASDVRPSGVGGQWGVAAWNRWTLLAATGLILLASGCCPTDAQAQDDGRWSVGAVAGSPGGITARYDASQGQGPAGFPSAYTALLSFDLDNYALLNLHAVLEHELPDSPITIFTGPGIATGFDGRLAMAGIAAVLGLRFRRARFEIFMQGHPRLMFVPDLRSYPGAGVGFRFHP